jgi:glucokinase
MTTILAADIGGTNSRFARYEVNLEGRLEPVETRWTQTAEADSFADLLAKSSGAGFTLRPSDYDIAVFAVAGPVESGVFSRPPNIAWTIDLNTLGDRFHFRKTVLVNDFLAQAYAALSHLSQNFQPVLSGRKDPRGVMGVIGAGTGLGHAALAPLGDGQWAPIASEGGHSSFPFQSAAETAYMQFLLEETGEPYVRSEVVVSGRGLSLLHRYLTGESLEPHEVAEHLHPESSTLSWMAGFYARICRNYALQILALGGLVIAGGLAAKNPAIVRHPAFEAEFRRSQTMEGLLDQIPVSLNTDEESGLWGAAQYGLMALESNYH